MLSDSIIKGRVERVYFFNMGGGGGGCGVGESLLAKLLVTPMEVTLAIQFVSVNPQ